MRSSSELNIWIVKLHIFTFAILFYSDNLYDSFDGSLLVVCCKICSYDKKFISQLDFDGFQ